MALLKVEGVHTFIQQYHILQGVSFEAQEGRVTVLLGRNGAGKTTTLRSIMGFYKINQGTICFDGEPIHTLPTHEIARRGISYVPEDQGIFSGLTVGENLNIAMRKNDENDMERLDYVLKLFPDLKTFWHKKGGHLSGGQKQMLALARAYIHDSRLMLIDEPSKGLAPIMVEKVMESIIQLKEKRTIVLVEQNFMMASAIGDDFYIIDNGRTVHSGRMEQLKEDKEMRQQYLGIT
ncbi:ABC transporter ATP-binding protein [Geobacillus zalihae]|jgi:branched-chain amino acid transport system ATP-binding protein|uniref:Branched-chain amino acid ABC transporter ATP-binding protein n=2 Tax=Geobacillus TaxID=129337 RepID=A0A7U9JC25_GEOTM|nr:MULTISPECIES: ABC transporter ATP-binding protein [Geobacillus]AGE22556.1 putative leucine ABC transporter permease [Geobacillus sp. GHH01]ESU72711.1 branched-chain amino acid ABC transporter ATP-binding protein [Geobacillus sp. MAS1]MED3668206.1 ABC transporter ATP-binding protein [Geobacillus kaustophilus]OPX03927.1 ABC transporter ATP-binding protein [Geobacillus sp. LEMMY01]OQP15970.1 ABC transporter ATP-binding protein [Geobacillus zalihae]